ncbi:MAG TPA: PIN domain-containing protein [archaeon]|nr:PIN domain-containing protein [archaeon]
MKILIDTSRIIAALTKDSTTRSILFDDFFEFVAPDYAISEIEEHKEEIIKKSKLTNEGFGILLALFFQRITAIPESEYKQFLTSCKNDISGIDDIPYLAACIATNSEGIWTHDFHFKEQKKVKVFTNIDMLRISGKAKSD